MIFSLQNGLSCPFWRLALFKLLIDKKSFDQYIKCQDVAGVVELVDTQVSDACGGNPVEVQVLSSAKKSSLSSLSLL